MRIFVHGLTLVGAVVVGDFVHSIISEFLREFAVQYKKLTVEESK